VSARWLGPLAAAALLAVAPRWAAAQTPVAQMPVAPGEPDVPGPELPVVLPDAPPLRWHVLPAVAPLESVRPLSPDVAPAPPPPVPKLVRVWKRSIELAGNLFLGSKPQSVLTTRGRASHADSTFELATDVRFTYGESSEDGARAVSQRQWLGTATLDLWPFASQSPFLLAGVESSLQRRIRLRVSGGIGHKMTFVDSEAALANLSVALLGERSQLPGADGLVTEERLARLSARLRLRRQIGERTSLSHESFFRPALYDLTAYTVSNSAAATYRVSETLNLKASYLDNYDSEARARGATTNYDGQVVLGLVADF